jgi:hypothetical protein
MHRPFDKMVVVTFMNRSDNAYPLSSREFALDPQYRRSGAYVAVGAVAAIILAAALNRVVLGRPWEHTAVAAIPMLAGVAFGCGIFWWRLRVDTAGIWRRRFVRWELWAWEDFASGQLRFGYSDRSFIDPRRPRWRRTLTLANLTELDREQLWHWIELVWRPTIELALPSVISITYGFLQRAVFDQSGVRMGRRNVTQYPWNDVVSLEIEKLRHDRDDFRRLVLTLPDRAIRLYIARQHGMTIESWRGATASVVAQFLTAHVAREKHAISAILDEARNVAEADRRIESTSKHLREIYRCRVAMRALLIGVVTWFAFNGDLLLAGLLSVHWLLFELVLAAIFRERNSEIKSLMRRKADINIKHEL